MTELFYRTKRRMKPAKGEINSGLLFTTQDSGYSIKELFDRFTAGVPLPDNQVEYLDQDIEKIDGTYKMPGDKLDLLDLRNSLRSRNAIMQAEIERKEREMNEPPQQPGTPV